MGTGDGGQRGGAEFAGILEQAGKKARITMGVTKNRRMPLNMDIFQFIDGQGEAKMGA